MAVISRLMTAETAKTSGLAMRMASKKKTRPRIGAETATLHAAHFVSQARKQAKLSQADLAEKIGVSQARVSRMEKGEGRYGLSITLLERVAAACGGTLQLKFKKTTGPKRVGA
jgi:DNA-binding XRE family transcriptional regulator